MALGFLFFLRCCVTLTLQLSHLSLLVQSFFCCYYYCCCCWCVLCHCSCGFALASYTHIVYNTYSLCTYMKHAHVNIHTQHFNGSQTKGSQRMAKTSQQQMKRRRILLLKILLSSSTRALLFIVSSVESTSTPSAVIVVVVVDNEKPKHFAKTTATRTDVHKCILLFHLPFYHFVVIICVCYSLSYHIIYL